MALKGNVTKYSFLFGYTVFFIVLQILLNGIASEVVNSPFAELEPPECSLGFIVIDGLLLCAFDYVSLFFSLFAISSSFFIIQAVFIIPFIVMLVLIIADLLRGSG